MDNKKQEVTPVTGDTALHLAYLRRDVDTIIQNQKENALQTQGILKEIRDGQVTRNEFDTLKVAVDKKADENDLTDLKKFVQERLVTKEDFAPIKKFVYGLVGVTLIAVITAVLALVIKTS